VRSETKVSEFPPARLDRANQCVWQVTPDGGQSRLNLRPRAYDLLQYLVDNAGRLVTHDEFLDALWQKVIVQYSQTALRHTDEIGYQ
jgi:DNA-binding response OmpR family regulator